MLLIEIVLMVTAWRKGWRAWTFLPLGAAFALAFMMGAAVGLSGGSPESARVAAIPLELGAIAALAFMARRVRTPVVAATPREIPVGSEMELEAGRSAAD